MKKINFQLVLLLHQLRNSNLRKKCSHVFVYVMDGLLKCLAQQSGLWLSIYITSNDPIVDKSEMQFYLFS